MSDQHDGINKTFSHTVAAGDVEEAQRLYQRAKARLLDINNWHHCAGKGTAVFQRMDDRGFALTGIVTLTDFIRIDLPGPEIGRDFDWVKVEALKIDSNYTKLIVRPCADPTTPEDDTAHFLSDCATSTFVVTIDKLTVSATILGKNEKPNDASKGLLKKTRDWLVGLGAIAGASDIQWNKLVKGFLENVKTD